MELRDVDGFPGYKVSDDGRVWSEKNQKWLKGYPVSGGYLMVGLCVDEKKHKKYIHRLVAQAFISNPRHLPQVNHRDEDITNNSVTNLEWCTSEYNVNYGTRTAKDKATKQRIYGKPVVQLTLDGKEVARFCCVNEAARQTGFNNGGISNVCLGNGKTYKGFCWKYLPNEGEKSNE